MKKIMGSKLTHQAKEVSFPLASGRIESSSLPLDD